MDQPPTPTPAELQAAYAVFRSASYLRHNARCQEHLASLGLDLANRTVLELGAGIGDHTTFFLDRGCTVTAIEPRLANCQIFVQELQGMVQRGYPGAQRCKLANCDMESLDRIIEGSFEIVYCYGLLYHLSDPASAIEAMSRKASEMLLLETCVSLGDHEALNPEPEDAANASQALRGMGCRPTRPWIFNRLRALFPYAYVPRTQPAHETFPLDWTVATPPQPLTRAVFIASRHPITNQALLDHLTNHQTLS